MSDYIISVDKVAMQNRINDIKNLKGDTSDIDTGFRALSVGDESQGPQGAQMREMKELVVDILALEQEIMFLTTTYMSDVREDFISRDENGG